MFKTPQFFAVGAQEDFWRQIREEIKTLRQQIENFQYAALRSIEVGDSSYDDRKRYHASQEIAVTLIEMFSKTFTFSKNPDIKSAFCGLKFWPVSRSGEVIALAAALRLFRNNIQESENTYFAPDVFLGKLADDSTWVLRFHYMIEQYLDTGLIQGISPRAYGDSIRNIKKLSEECYAWLELNAPEKMSEFAVLKDKMREERKRPAQSASPII